VATRTDRIHSRAQSSDMAVLTLLRDRPHPTEYLVVSAKTQGILLYDGNIYQVLERLMAQGLVDRAWATGGNGLPQRMYGLTQAGQRVAGRYDVSPA
jgi:DNA-binding PadR family transcriptional regulator